MMNPDQNTSVESDDTIRILHLNTDKTRRSGGSGMVYQVYFELSKAPPQAWRNIFEGQWKILNPDRPHLWQAAGIDGTFLVVHCPLGEIAVQLSVLKKAVSATNNAHEQYLRQQATEEERREEVWKQERQAVEEIAKSLQF